MKILLASIVAAVGALVLAPAPAAAGHGGVSWSVTVGHHGGYYHRPACPPPRYYPPSCYRPPAVYCPPPHYVPYRPHYRPSYYGRGYGYGYSRCR